MIDDRGKPCTSVIPRVVSTLANLASGLIRRGLDQPPSSINDSRSAFKTDERDRVLIVDDDQAIQEVCGNILTEAGYEVRITLNGFDAVRIAKEFRPHVALLGFSMRAGDGVRLGMELSDLFPQTKIVLRIEVDCSQDMDDFVGNGYRFGLLPWPIEKEDFLHRMMWWMIRARDSDLVTGFGIEGMLNCTLRLQSARRDRLSIIFFDVFEDWHKENADVSPRERRKLLGELARWIDATRRAIDSPYRYGENNFALVLHNASKDFAEKMRGKLSNLIHETDWHELSGCPVSLIARFAIASLPDNEHTIEELVARAMETLSGESATS